jgi:hypothetical protein
MNYRKFSFTNEDYLILREIKTYHRTDSGKSWRSKPTETEREIVSAENYTNYITAVPFFNSWGNGASCRASHTYEIAGYLPTRVTTVSPYGEVKKVATFSFISKRDMLDKAGWRETEIVNNARTWEYEYNGGRELYTLYTEADGVTTSGLWDNNSRQWRG